VSADLVQERCWVCGSDILVEDNFCRKCGVELIRAETASKTASRFEDTDRQAAIGIFLTVMGALVGLLSYLMGIIPMLAFGLASLLVGILILYLPERKGSIASRLATDSSLPSLLNIENLLEDLDLDERGIYIPASGMGVCPRVFVPLAETQATRQPPVGLVNSRRIFVTVGKNPEDRGVLLDAPGSQIMVALERSLRVDFSKMKLDDLGAAFNSGFRALGIAKVTNFEHQDFKVTIQVELTRLVDLETKLRNEAPRLVAQVGTPVTSAVAAAVSKAAGKYVTFKSAVLDLPNKKLNINLKISP
jgi:hypothetical protein